MLIHIVPVAQLGRGYSNFSHRRDRFEAEDYILKIILLALEHQKTRWKAGNTIDRFDRRVDSVGRSGLSIKNI